jgi:hypothetical protein
MTRCRYGRGAGCCGTCRRSSVASLSPNNPLTERIGTILRVAGAPLASASGRTTHYVDVGHDGVRER